MVLNSLTEILIITGAVIGSLKASKELDKQDTISTKVINFMVGVFWGISIGMYYGTNLNPYISSLVALIGGAIGTLTIELVIQLAPNLIQDKIKKWFEK